MKALSIALVALALSLPNAATAQERTTVKFKPGNYGTMVSGKVRGHGYHDYRLSANKGQELFAELTATGGNGNGSVFFNILPPGSDNVAIYNGSMDGGSTLVPLPETGTYTIRVYLMGNDEDAGKTVTYNLDLSIQ